MSKHGWLTEDQWWRWMGLSFGWMRVRSRDAVERADALVDPTLTPWPERAALWYREADRAGLIFG